MPVKSVSFLCGLFLLGAATLATALQPARSGSRFTTLAGFELGAGATLGDVTRKLGPAPLQEAGESGAYRAGICYASPDAVVHFLSDAMGGHHHQLLGYAITTPQTADARGCAKADLPFVARELDIAGLHLGMTRAQLQALLGKDIEWQGDQARRIYASQEPLRDSERAAARDARGAAPDSADITISIFATFAGQRLQSFEVWKIRAY